MIKKIHHIGIVVRNLEEAFGFYKDTLGLPLGKMATIQDQGVKAALLPIGESEIELLEPITADVRGGSLPRKKGGGLHHLCFETDNVETELQGAKDKGIKVIDQKPRPGSGGHHCVSSPSSLLQCAGRVCPASGPQRARLALRGGA